MGLFLTIGALLIGCFICLVNMHYREIECKNHSTWKKESALNSPKAWGLYASCIGIILGALFIASIRNVVLGFSSISTQTNAITQQQQAATEDTTTEDTTNQQQGTTTLK